MLLNIFTGWKFDIKTAIVTVVLAPLMLYILLIIRRYLKNWGRYAVEGGMYWLGRLFKRSLAGALTLKSYCRLRLAEENRYLHVPSSLDIKLDIERVYVTLTMDSEGSEKNGYTHIDILTAGNRIRVIGDPGSGKSSLVKRLFRDACYNAVEHPSKSKIPFLLELKNLEVPTDIKDQNLGSWFLEKLHSDAIKSKVYEMSECLNTYSQDAGLLVLLDGLDEVASTHYPRVQKAIEGLSEILARMSNNNTIVLTMRTQFHQQIKDIFRESFGQAMFIKPFSPNDIYQFLTRWPFKSKSDANIARIYKELTDRPTLREMCTNPLILSMYVAEDQAVGHVIAPDSRTEFYRKVTEELMIKRRLRQTGNAPAHAKLLEQRERILGRLAYYHMLDINQPTNSLKWSEALHVIRDVMKCKKSEAESIFFEIAKETGLVSEERKSQTFRFIHLTFCEFLAAFEAVEGQHEGWLALMEAHKHFRMSTEPQIRSRLIEVIPFACGLLPRVKRQSAIMDVSSVEDEALLARCFLETKLYDHECWPMFVERQKDSLLRVPEENWDKKWLGDLYLFNVVMRDAVRCSTHMPSINIPLDLQAFFQTLVSQQRDSLSKLLEAFASQDAAAAFRLAEVSNLDLAKDFPQILISNCDQAPFFALVREQALRETDRVEFLAPLLAESALRYRVVSNWLLEVAPAQQLGEYVLEVPRKSRWFRRGFLPNSLYTQILTIACGPKARLSSSLTMLNIIRKMPAPGSFNLIKAFIPLALLPLLMVFSLIIEERFISDPNLFVPINLVMAVLFYSAVLFALFKFLGPRNAYRVVAFQPSSFQLLLLSDAPKEMRSFLHISREMIRGLLFLVIKKDSRILLKKIHECRLSGFSIHPESEATFSH